MHWLQCLHIIKLTHKFLTIWWWIKIFIAAGTVCLYCNLNMQLCSIGSWLLIVRLWHLLRQVLLHHSFDAQMHNITLLNYLSRKHSFEVPKLMHNFCIQLLDFCSYKVILVHQIPQNCLPRMIPTSIGNWGTYIGKKGK